MLLRTRFSFPKHNRTFWNPLKSRPKQIIEVDLSANGLSLVEADPPKQFLSQKSQQKIPLFRALNALQKAAFDDNIKGASFQLGKKLAISDVQELRKIIKLFRSRGKSTSVFSESYAADWNYYLASAFENIWMLPTGILELSPKLETPTTHWKTPINNLGIDLSFIRMKSHKATGLVDLFSSEQSKEGKEEKHKLFIEGWWKQCKQDIEEDGRISQELLEDVYKQGPLLFSNSEEIKKMITGIDYQDKVTLKQFKESGFDCSKMDLAKERSKYLVSVGNYIKKIEKEEGKKVSPGFVRQYCLFQGKPSVVAVIPIEGAIGTESRNGVPGIDSSKVKRIIRQAAEDPQVKAIVIRCTSGGGSAQASDIIAHEIENAKLRGKPVVFSMGRISASGGYWIAAPASSILAERSSIAGSIGVFMPRMSIHKMLTDKGVVVSEEGNPADSLYSVSSPESEEKIKIFQRVCEGIYSDFLNHVSSNRKIDLETLEGLAQGKVYTGVEALELRLIDKVGGFHDAVGVAAELGGISVGEAGLPLMRVFPSPLSKTEQLMRMLSGAGPRGKNSEDIRINGYFDPSAPLNDISEQLLSSSLLSIADGTVLQPFIASGILCDEPLPVAMMETQYHK